MRIDALGIGLSEFQHHILDRRVGAIQHHAHTLQHDTSAPIAKLTPLLGDRVHFQTGILVIGRVRAQHRLGIDIDQDARPAPRDRMFAFKALAQIKRA